MNIILYSDDNLIVVNKPAGIAVHASPGHECGSLADELGKLFPEIYRVGSRERPGVVHRLDIDTSGVMVFARSQIAYTRLRAMFEAHRGIKKTYLAVVHGTPKPRKGEMITLIGHSSGKRKMRVFQMSEINSPKAQVANAVKAVTRWETLQSANGLSIVEFRIETGRTHQIRVHAANMGCPIAGDTLYGVSDRAPRLLLHAVQLEFNHPITGEAMCFAAEPPREILYP